MAELLDHDRSVFFMLPVLFALPAEKASPIGEAAGPSHQQIETIEEPVLLRSGNNPLLPANQSWLAFGITGIGVVK